MQKIKINLEEKYEGEIKIMNFNFTIDLAAVGYAEHIDEYHWFKIDISNGEIHELGNQIINNNLATLQLYRDSSFWRIHSDWNKSSDSYDFEWGISLETMEMVCTGINDLEKEKLGEFVEKYFYSICEEVLGLASTGIYYITIVNTITNKKYVGKLILV